MKIAGAVIVLALVAIAAAIGRHDRAACPICHPIDVVAGRA